MRSPARRAAFLGSTAICAVFAALLPDRGTAASTQGAVRLEQEISRLGDEAGGVVGVTAWRLDGAGPRVAVRGQERFPMASTFKIAIAGAVFAGIDAGRLSLGQMVDIDPGMRVRSEVLADRFIHPGISVSVHNLLELMLGQSDNTATDVLLALAGGPQAVTGWLRRLEVVDQRIDRDTAGQLRDFFALPPGPFSAALEAAQQADPELLAQATRPNPRFEEDPRDTSTPIAMAELLTLIFSGRALEPASTAALTDMMLRCRTGEGRLKGRLPPGTVVAHKTGSIGGTVNDVGVMDLPAGQGRLVIVVFVKKSDQPLERRERLVADIARSVHDYFLLVDENKLESTP